jgi:sphinganine-1-phosphate aldolase
MEAEVVQMCVNMFKGNREACGIVDTSEADCIRNSVLAHKKWAKDVKGVTKPNVVAPNTFDPSLDRACEVMDVEVRRIPLDDKLRFNVSSLSSYVDDNTVAIFCSAPDGYFGVFGKF